MFDCLNICFTFLFQDLDFMELHPDGLMLEKDTYDALVKTIQRDCRVRGFITFKR